MPTPSSEQVVDDPRILHASCPPEEDRSSTWRTPDSVVIPSNEITSPMVDEHIMAPQSEPQSLPGSTETYIGESQQLNKQIDIAEEVPSSDMMSPASVDDKPEGSDQQVALTDSYAGGSPSMSYEFSNVRLIPSSPSSFLRAGSKFRGTQQSERQVYDVQVDIKHVDMRESFLCGYLRIQGLTEDHPTLTTYFEGEIIGSKYTFLTQHEDWGSTDKVDLQHWAKFQAFRPFAKQARKGNLYIPQLAQRENIFMRWKEHFLVPDHRVRTISGASFEGFYYICFNQLQGKVSGIYFHAKSEKFQQLELEHVPDRGCFGAMEFR